MQSFPTHLSISLPRHKAVAHPRGSNSRFQFTPQQTQDRSIDNSYADISMTKNKALRLKFICTLVWYFLEGVSQKLQKSSIYHPREEMPQKNRGNGKHRSQITMRGVTEELHLRVEATPSQVVNCKRPV